MIKHSGGKKNTNTEDTGILTHKGDILLLPFCIFFFFKKFFSWKVQFVLWTDIKLHTSKRLHRYW